MAERLVSWHRFSDAFGTVFEDLRENMWIMGWHSHSKLVLLMAVSRVLPFLLSMMINFLKNWGTDLTLKDIRRFSICFEDYARTRE